MANQIKVKRGQEINLPALQIGEPAFTTDTKTFYVGSDTGNIKFKPSDESFTSALKNKLDGIATGAEVNQNAFSTVKVGATNLVSDLETDTLEFAAGTGITLTPDAANDKITIAVTSGTYAGETHTHAGTDITSAVANATSAVNATTAAACSGNSATATKLITARTINGVSFDGSANITISAVPSAHTHAGADITSAVATATALATARTIAGTSFNGTANISIDHGNLTGLTGDDHTQYIKADGTRAFTGVVSGVTPTLDSHLATKAYVDGVAQGLDVKAACKVATTGNIADLAAGAPNSVDSTSIQVGDRILVKNQSTTAQNGIYVVQTLGTGANGTWVRASDFDGSPAGEITSGAFTFVTLGTLNNNSGWVLINNDPITLGTTPLAFAQFSGAGTIIAGTGISRVGYTISLASGVVTTGTYKSVTVDTYGRVTAGTNPTTLAGYGITDAATSSHNHTLDGLSNTTITSVASGEIIKWSGTAWVNNTLAEAGVAAASHTHAGTDITSAVANATTAASCSGNAATATALATSRTFSITGDVTATGVNFNGTAAVALSTTLANSGVSAGTYKSVTVDIKGRVTAGTNPTTLAGYGITDALSVLTYADLASVTLTTSTTTANQVVSSVAIASYRTLKYMIQVVSGTSYHVTELLMVHDGTTAYLTEYATIMTGVSLATFDADINSGNLRLLVTPVNAVTVIKAFRVAIEV